MQRGESKQTTMESLRLKCNREIFLNQQKTESFAASSLHSLDSMKATAMETLQIQGEVLTVKSRLKEAEDELVKALAVKTRKEAKRMAALDAISAVKARVEELKRIELDQKARRNDCSAIESRESLALAAIEEKNEQESKEREEIQEAISWYNRILGLQIEGGSGVKFMFKSIHTEKPEKMYSFTIRHANDMYTLLECDPPLDCVEELMHELNNSNDLYKFVRIVRKKFLEAAEQGSSLEMLAAPQLSSTIALSAPPRASSSMTDKGESPATESRYDTEAGAKKKVNQGRRRRLSKAENLVTPGSSSSSLRRSSRSKLNSEAAFQLVNQNHML